MYDPAGHRLMELVWGKPDRLKQVEDKARNKADDPDSAKRKREDELTAEAELTFAKTFAKAGKVERAREKAQSIIERFSMTKAAAEAQAILKKLK